MKLAPLLLVATVPLPLSHAKPRIATLDVRKAVQSTREGKAAVAELERKFRPSLDKLAYENSLIEVLRNQLGKITITHLSKPGSPRVRTATTAARTTCGIKIEEEERRVLNELGPKLLLVAEKYAKQKHFEVIVDESEPKAAIIWRDNKNDITEQVIKLYDQPAKKP
jgi:Skp family chaperone for outer membrane proteins